MNRTEIIKDIVNTYNNTTWYTLRSNIETAIFASGKSINIYNDFPVLLDKTKNTISDLWNHEKKFILMDVCKIAEFIGCNVYTLFYSFDSLLVSEFKKKDSENQKNEIFQKAGRMYIEAETLRKKGDKSIFIWNLRHYVNTEEYDMNIPYLYKKLAPKAIDLVMDACFPDIRESKYETVRCWLTASRYPRIHMTDLIKVCEMTGIDIIDILSVKAEG